MPVLRTSYKSLLFILSLLALQHCSRKKDTFVSRNFHAMGTKYNVLYNGNLALESGKATINDAYTENFWELLPVERMQVKEDVLLPNEAQNQDFERAEDKAIKAVQTHGMNIEGKERNPQIDEAYLLLGKARYYDQRFVPALDAFNNIMNRYPTSDKINQVKVWREKANMRLGNEEIALKNLKRHVYQEELEGQDLADIAATMAQCYINLKYKDSALTQLAVAAENTKVNNEKARYNYIIGQLYDEFGKTDSANIAYDRVIKLHRKIPRTYYINAHLAKARNFDLESGDKIAFEEYLAELEENRENRPYLDKVYYGIAEYHRANDSEFKAEAYYNDALRANSADKNLNSRVYNILGDMYFDRREYEVAGAYFDSTLTNMELNSKPYRVVKKKRENLEDVIYYEGIAKSNDSILRILRMPEAEQKIYFAQVAEEMRQKQLELEEQQKAQEQKAKNLEASRTSMPSMLPGGRRQDVGGIRGSGESFYFYNPSTVAFGKNEFLKLWGTRELADNWRLSSGSIVRPGVVDSVQVAQVNTDEFDPSIFISQLPQTQTEIDSIIKERNFAYYQLGVIYKEKFNEYNLSISKFEDLLDNNPEDRLILPSKYNLVKLYELTGRSRDMETVKSDIVSNYPDSRYAEILLNPESEVSKDANSPEEIYKGLYALYDQQKYQEVIDIAEEQIKRLEGDAFVPKFEILKASANGRLNGFQAYREAVNYVALTYPNSPEGKTAQKLLQEAIPQMSKREFIADEDALFFNLIYEFNAGEEKKITELIDQLNAIIEPLTYYDLSVSKDVYTADKTLVVIHGFKTLSAASSFGKDLEYDKKKRRPRITKPYFAISSPNYAIIQRHKNLEVYLNAQ